MYQQAAERCNPQRLAPTIRQGFVSGKWQVKDQRTPETDPNTIAPKLSTSPTSARPVLSDDFCAFMSKPAFPPKPQRQHMMMNVTIHAYRSYVWTML